jgi:hypothetical protein
MLKKYGVTLSVSMQVYADHANDAVQIGRDWLQGTLQAATNDAVSYPVVTNTRRGEVTESVEKVHDPSDWEQRVKSEVAHRRQSVDRYELLKRVAAAQTTEDYVALQPDVSAYARGVNHFYADPLGGISNLLEGFAEAVRWGETHPNGPYVWKTGEILVRLKDAIAREFAVTRQVLGLSEEVGETEKS